MLRTLLILALLTLAACTQGPAIAETGADCSSQKTCPAGMGCSGLFYDKSGSCIAEADANAACEKADGQWGRWGMSGRTYCNQIMADAGKPCLDKADCLGNCISTSETTGECQRLKQQFGCFSTMQKGQKDATLCVD